MFALLLLWAFPATAQEPLQRTVVLNVSEGGTELLVAEIGAISVVELKDQGWFLEEVRARKLRAKKLLTRPKDLRFVMSGSNTQWVIHVDFEDGQYSGRIFGADGELASSRDLGGEFGQVEAAEMRAEFEALLGIDAEVVEAIEITPDEVGSSDPVETTPKVVETSAAEPEAAAAPKGEGGFGVGLSGRLLKRDLTFAGANNAVLNYDSAFYPGFGLALQYVFGGISVGPGLLGLDLDVVGGFDAIEDASVLHLEGAFAVGLYFGAVNVRVGGRHVRYTVSDSDVFPSLSHTLVLLGLGMAEPLGPLRLVGDVELYPWGTYAADGKPFGASSSEIGFAGRLGLGYGLSDTFGVTAGYGFRVGRASFAGNGTLDFIDSRGFELVHGPELGITWHP